LKRKTAPTYPSESGQRIALARGAILAVAALAAYLPALQAGFVWDDRSMLTGNELIKSLHGLIGVWLGTGSLDYLPLTYSVLGLEWRVWGMNPLGYHVVNLLLHAGSAMLLWRVLLRLRVTGAWWAAVIFAVHPVMAASVAWVAEIKNTLSMVFYLSAILFFLHYDASGKRSAYGLALGMFFLALLSKTSVVMLPVVLLLCVWWQRRRITWRNIGEAVPFFALSLAFGLITIWFQTHNAINDASVPMGGWGARVAAAGWAAWFYFFNILFPVHLSALYAQRALAGGTISSYLPAAAMAAAVAIAWGFRRTWGRPVLFALSYFLLTLFPVLGFFKMYYFRLSPVADQWQYLAAPGIIALVVAAGGTGWHRVNQPRLGKALAVAVVVLLAFQTWQRAAVYRNEETLWRDVLAKDANSWTAHINLALVCLGQGKPAEALAYGRRAAELEPEFVESHLNLGAVLDGNNLRDEAVEQYRKAVALRPGFGQAHRELGLALERAGHPNEAIAEYREAIRLADAFQFRIDLGAALFSQDRYGEALEQFQAAVLLRPDSASAHNNLGGVFFMQEKYAAAAAEYEAALRLNPDSTEARQNLEALRQINKP